jgi:hypothetical protein
VKHIQTLPYLSQEWRSTYGMRNLVESSNNLLKLPTAEDMANAVVSSNLNRIVTFFTTEAKRASKDQVLHRARR